MKYSRWHIWWLSFATINTVCHVNAVKCKRIFPQCIFACFNHLIDFIVSIDDGIQDDCHCIEEGQPEMCMTFKVSVFFTDLYI